jgi:hypothetical protein
MRKIVSLGTVSSLAILLACQAVLAQPTLLPPGPPTGPSGRMGVRTEITTIPYIITLPGSYYLSSTLFQIAPGDGITIDSSNVTIDLMGFALIGGGFPGDDAIGFGPGIYQDVTVHNGFVAFWGGAGLNLGTGGGPVPDIHVYEITAYGNMGSGIVVGPQSIVRHCIASNNGSWGIYLDRYCKLTNGIAVDNGLDGIFTGVGCHVSDSVAALNAANGFFLGMENVLIGSTAGENGSNGVMLTMGSRVTDCTASMNGFTAGFGSGFFAGGDGNILGGCAAFNNFGSGFESIPAGPGAGGSSVHDCIATSNGYGTGLGDGFMYFKGVVNSTATGNANNGIECLNGAHVFRNTSEGNGANGVAAFGEGNVIEQNNLVSNTLSGIDTTFNPGPGGNVIAGNRAHLNGFPAYAFAPFDTTGAIFFGAGVMPVDPWLNVGY